MGNLKIRYRFDKRTGRVVELVVHDDTRPEEDHDRIARAIADELVLGADIVEERVLVSDDLRGRSTETDTRPNREKDRE